MDNDYLIIDPRPLEEFKDKTFSEFKKKDVFNELAKSMETGKVENTCFWVTECIVSGYTMELFEKLLIFSTKIVHINNPKLPQFLWLKYSSFMNSIDHISKKDRKQYIHLRNTQSVRNCLCDVAVTISMSPKSKRYDKYPKPKEDKDYSFSAIKSKMNATMQLLPSHIIKFTDPEELRVIMNELFFNLKNNLGGYDNACYWVAWLIQWEKINKKKKQSFEIEERPIKGLKKNLCRDLIWLVWSVIFEEANLRDNEIKKQIQALFLLYKHNFTSGKRNVRLPYVYQAIGYLTLPIKFNIKVRKDEDTFLKTQCNINKIFRGKKKHEIKNYTEKNKKEKTISLDNEKTNSKLSTIKEIDGIFFY